jgi:hypothetical protein
MKAYGNGCIDPHFLDLGINWNRVVSFMSQPLYPRYQLDKRLGGPQRLSGRRGENSWPYWDSNSDPSVVLSVVNRYTDYAITAVMIIKSALI